MILIDSTAISEFSSLSFCKMADTTLQRKDMICTWDQTLSLMGMSEMPLTGRIFIGMICCSFCTTKRFFFVKTKISLAGA